MNYCSNCGTKTETGAKFCQNCGAALVETTSDISLDGRIKVETTSATTEKAFKVVGKVAGDTFPVVEHKLKALTKVILILFVVGALIYAACFLYGFNLKKDKEKIAQGIEEAIKEAQETTPRDNEEWRAYGAIDPASGQNIATTASVRSDDGLCTIYVEERGDGVELTSFSCHGFSIASYPDIQSFERYNQIKVKFDTERRSHAMGIAGFSDSNDVYTSEFTVKEYHLAYKKFIEKLLKSDVVAIKITPTFSHKYDDLEEPFSYETVGIFDNHLDPIWVKFSLDGASDAISKLGKEVPVIDAQ